MLFFLFYIRTIEHSKLYSILKFLTFGTVIIFIALDIINTLIQRHSHQLLILLQNSMPLIFLALLIIFFSKINKKDSKYSLYLMMIYSLWIPLSFIINSVSLRLQYKSIGFVILILIGLFTIKLLNIFLPRMKSRISNKISPLIVSVFLLISILITFPIVIEFAMNNIDREGSGLVRIAVAQVMITQVLNDDLFTIFFGFGLGSSSIEFPLEHFLPEGVFYPEAKPHSGIIALFYEHGILGIGFLLFLTSLFIKRSFFNTNLGYMQSSLYYNKRLTLMMLVMVLLLWISQNIITANGIIVIDPYHYAQTILYLVLTTYLSNILFTRNDEK